MEFENFDNAMEFLSQQFVEDLRSALSQPYPFAPGFNFQRQPFGTANKIASGELYESIQVSYNAEKKQITLTMAEYWKYVNDGRRPGKYVPLNSLLKWIKSRRLKGRNKKTGRFITNESFAWGINQNIKKFGIAPTYFYDKAFQTFEKNFENESLKALGLDIDTFFNNLFEE